MTGVRQIIRGKRHHELSFFGRIKSPQHEGLAVVRPSDPAFCCLTNYRYYRLMDPSHVHLARKSKKPRKQVIIFKAMFENTKFREEEPILVFDFLTAFVAEADTIGVFETNSISIMPNLLKGRVKGHLRWICNGAQSGVVTCCPEVVNHFHSTCATPTTLRIAVNDLQNIRQEPRDDELTYSRLINDVVYRYETCTIR